MANTRPFDLRAVEYDTWFEEHRQDYLSELEAVRTLLPEHSRSIEIGVGTGRFAGPLGVMLGIEPSGPMAEIARARGIEVVEAVAEDLPFYDSSFDLVLMITAVCFLDDVDRSFREAHRVLAAGGHIVVGFLDRETELGRSYEARKAESSFYRFARFHSSSEVLDALSRAGFEDVTTVQTIFSSSVQDETGRSPVERGHGEGLFVVARGRKRPESAAV